MIFMAIFTYYPEQTNRFSPQNLPTELKDVSHEKQQFHIILIV